MDCRAQEKRVAPKPSNGIFIRFASVLMNGWTRSPSICGTRKCAPRSKHSNGSSPSNSWRWAWSPLSNGGRGADRSATSLRLEARALGAAVEPHYLDAPIDVLFERIHERGMEQRAIQRADLLRWVEHFQVPTAEEMALFHEVLITSK